MSVIELDKGKLEARLVELVILERDRLASTAVIRAQRDEIAVEIGRLRDQDKALHAQARAMEGDLPALMQEKSMLARVLGNGSVLKAEAQAFGIDG